MTPISITLTHKQMVDLYTGKSVFFYLSQDKHLLINYNVKHKDKLKRVL